MRREWFTVIGVVISRAVTRSSSSRYLCPRPSFRWRTGRPIGAASDYLSALKNNCSASGWQSWKSTNSPPISSQQASLGLLVGGAGVAHQRGGGDQGVAHDDDAAGEVPRRDCWWRTRSVGGMAHGLAERQRLAAPPLSTEGFSCGATWRVAASARASCEMPSGREGFLMLICRN
jgi:hypothetical protein